MITNNFKNKHLIRKSEIFYYIILGFKIFIDVPKVVLISIQRLMMQSEIQTVYFE